jgi:D-threo-aldose 1-dehydrogenase
LIAQDRKDPGEPAIKRRFLPRCPTVGVSELGFGGAAIGNLFRALDDATAHDAIATAISGGIRYFDTAPYYGYGLSEMRLGKFLADKRAPQVALSTKVGRLLRARAANEEPVDDGFVDTPDKIMFYDYSRAGILASLAESKERLGRQTLDIVLLHDVGRRTHGDDHEKIMRTVFDEALPTLAELKHQGVISAYGIGVSEPEVCLEILERADLDCILLSGRYTLLEQGVLKDLLPLCVERGVGVIVGGPFNSGLLASAVAPGTTYEYAAVPSEVLERARNIYAICREHQVDVGAAALQFPLAHPAVVSVIPGSRTAGEATDNLGRYATPIPAVLWPALKQAGLIDASAPCPP